MHLEKFLVKNGKRFPLITVLTAIGLLVLIGLVGGIQLIRHA